MKLTVVQKITLLAIVAYIIWEIAVQQWANDLPPSDPVIRADLILIIPILAILIIISLIQFIRRRNKD